MDEPTNDLDVETLELLEELLGDFQGTLLLVSHDRALLDSVVTSTLVFEGEGRVREYVGGYEDWLRQRPAVAPPPQAQKTPKPAQSKPAAQAARASTKLSYKDRRELEALPARIQSLEDEVSALHARLADPAFYQQGGEAIAAAKDRLTHAELDLEQAYARWEDLEGREG
jgi:ABC transport system ATP-binding/permease protein